MPLSASIAPPAPSRPKLGKTLRQVWRITRTFFASERRSRARGLAILLVTLSIASVGITVLTSYCFRDFMTAIERRHTHGFWLAMAKWVGSFGLAMLIDVFFRWAQDSLALAWREWLTQHLIKRYLNNRAYYRLRGSESIDNPDQRISEDVRNFTVDSLSYALMAMSSVMTLFGFLGVLWSISGELVGLALVYAFVGTYLCFLIGRKLVGFHYERYQREGDMRYGLVRVRDNAESIAFYRGEKREHLDLVRRLAALVLTMRTIIGWNRKLGYFRISYDYLARALPFLIAGPMFMHGELQFGHVAQAAEAFAQVLGAVTLISSNFEGMSAYLAGSQRLGSLWDDLDDFDADEDRIALESKQQLDETSSLVRLDNLTVITPDRTKILARELTFELHPRQSLIIMGESGAGKSSVLRTIAGLWPGGSGSLERPALNHLMFLPQRPYMVPGSLRDQLRYPFPDRGLDDDEIRQVVEQVNLADVLARVDSDFDCVIDWRNVLSLGEQQRVAFARLFLRKPQFAFLDEATSALDETNQSRLYELIRQSGIGFISVAHRITVLPFHDRVLHLGQHGEWEIRDVVG